MMNDKFYNGGKVIAEKGNLILTRPRNSWDMNYHIHNTENDLEYLVDIGDVFDTFEELEQHDEAGILFEELKQLDFDNIFDNIWKTINADGENVPFER